MEIKSAATFQLFVNFAKNSASDDAVAKLDRDPSSGFQDHSFSVSESKQDHAHTINPFTWGKRDPKLQDINNQVRNTFRDAVYGMFGGEAHVPQSVKDAMKLADYGSGKESTLGRPLSVRRIKDVAAAIANATNPVDDFVKAAFDTSEDGGEVRVRSFRKMIDRYVMPHFDRPVSGKSTRDGNGHVGIALGSLNNKAFRFRNLDPADFTGKDGVENFLRSMHNDIRMLKDALVGRGDGEKPEVKTAIAELTRFVGIVGATLRAKQEKQTLSGDMFKVKAFECNLSGDLLSDKVRTLSKVSAEGRDSLEIKRNDIKSVFDVDKITNHLIGSLIGCVEAANNPDRGYRFDNLVLIASDKDIAAYLRSVAADFVKTVGLPDNAYEVKNACGTALGKTAEIFFKAAAQAKVDGKIDPVRFTETFMKDLNKALVNALVSRLMTKKI